MVLKGFVIFVLKLWSFLFKGKYFIVHHSSLKSHLNNPVREGFAYKLGMTIVPMDSNQGTPPKGDPYAFPFFGNVGTPLMPTLNIPGLNVGLPVWRWSTLNIMNVLKLLK